MMNGDDAVSYDDIIVKSTGFQARKHAKSELRQSKRGRDGNDDPGTPASPYLTAEDALPSHDNHAAPSMDDIYASSPMYVDDSMLEEMRRRPGVSFLVRNEQGSGKADAVSAASSTRLEDSRLETQASSKAKKRQSWNSPIHVPLAHRKLVESPRIFQTVVPTRPANARPPRPRGPPVTGPSPRKTPRLSSLNTPNSNQTSNSSRESLMDRNTIQRLRECNADIYERLVQRFRCQKRTVLPSEPEVREPMLEEALVEDVVRVEDAILYFLNQKHKHDVLYFKRKAGVRAGVNQVSGGRLSLRFSSITTSGTDASLRYMPYDLERTDKSPAPGGGDYYIMSSSSIVHHSNDNDSEVAGEAIPISQWVMESKMFSLLLAGIPLFQKFLMRKIFVWWVNEARRLIYVDMRKRIAMSLPFARVSFVRPMLYSCTVLRRIQGIRALGLPSKRATTVGVGHVQEYHKEQLSATETKLIDAKEELLSLMDSMVLEIQHNINPSTELDELYAAEAHTLHTSNPSWKSVPISALKMRKLSLHRTKQTARLDMTLIERYIKMMEYMFAESVYLMVISCVAQLTHELLAEENCGVICASVTIAGETLMLSPSTTEIKDMLMESIARLVRLASNFHFAKNAMTWSNNRGTGALAAVAASFASSSSVQFDLQEVLRTDQAFGLVTSDLVEELSRCFKETLQQMKAFEALKPIYASVLSLKNRTPESQEPVMQLSGSSMPVPAFIELRRITGISGNELSRYLKGLTFKFSVLDRSQHACQKIQCSWKVTFLEIQCRRSVSEILDMIAQQRNALHQQLYQLACDGVQHCITALQSANATFEDRPQLIEYFCEQMKQVRVLKDNEKQLQQDIRNVDEAVRALRRYAPTMAADNLLPCNVLHNLYTKYSSVAQAHAKFATKMLPNITMQVNNALQKYTTRCQRLLRIYDEYSVIGSEEELDKHVGMFQDISQEIKTIEDATKLYQEYQRMVGLKITEIPMLEETREKWDEVQDVVTFTIQWKTALSLMENGIFSDQPWKQNVEKITSFLPRIQVIKERKEAVFAIRLVEHHRYRIIDYIRKLELAVEMAQPFVKQHHWTQILGLLGVVDYVSASGVMVSDGSTLTLGFLQTRCLWDFEPQVREITQRARHDAITEAKLEEMKKRLMITTLPLVRSEDSFEIDCASATTLLEVFEEDLLNIQTLAQMTTSPQLHAKLVQWAEELSSYQDMLDTWINVQSDWIRLGAIFCLDDVQQRVADASFEFIAIDRKWRAMMNAAKSSSSLAVCLREVMSYAFLSSSKATFEKLWKELGDYLSDKRHFFPRLNFISDRDLLELISHTRYPSKLSGVISKCFREITSLSYLVVDERRGQEQASGENVEQIPREDDVGNAYEVHGVVGTGHETLSIRTLRITASPEIWMNELCHRIRESTRELTLSAMDGTFSSLYESNFDGLLRAQTEHPHLADAFTDGAVSHEPYWGNLPLQIVILCVNISMTTELTPLVRQDRSGGGWRQFWKDFHSKKRNLIEGIKQVNQNPHDRLICSNVLTLMMNKRTAIRDLYNEPAGDKVFIAGGDVASCHASYTNGDTFAWTKLMRYYIEPFERRCVVHQSVKTSDYGFGYLGGYSCPIISPLCDRVLLALNLATTLEIGGLVHSTTDRATGKRTLIREFAASVGLECLPFDCSIGVGLAQLRRILHGALQCDTCWISMFGFEVACNLNVVHVFATEMNRLKDAIYGGQEVFHVDGAVVDIINSRVGVFVSCSLDYGRSDHHELLLQLSYSFMPISCPKPDLAVILDMLLMKNAFSDWSSLSRKLHTLFLLVENDPTSFGPIALSLHEIVNVVRRAIHHREVRVWKTEDYCLAIAVWEELHMKVLPERRVSFFNYVRIVFPTAETLRLTAVGTITSSVPLICDKKSVSPVVETEESVAGSNDTDENPLGYDSDEESEKDKLCQIRSLLEEYTESRNMIAADPFSRKLMELFHVVSSNVVTIVVGDEMCGKSTVIDILSGVFQKAQHLMGAAVANVSDSANYGGRVRALRLCPEAFTFDDVFGHFRDEKTWVDGFVTHFMKQSCELPAAGHQPTEERPQSSRGSTGNASISHNTWLVLDGLTDSSFLAPLRNLSSSSPDVKHDILIPNGDQLYLENPFVRIFCEVTSLEQWAPSVLSRFGIFHLDRGTVPYTLLIKSWGKQASLKYSSSIPLAVKLLRSALPALLEICKRHSKVYVEFGQVRAVGSALRLLSVFMENLNSDIDSRDKDTSVIVAYSLVLSLGLPLLTKGRAEFHECIIHSIPEIWTQHRELFPRSKHTVFDLCITIVNQRLHMSSWQAKLDTHGIDWNHTLTRRNSGKSLKPTKDNTPTFATSSASATLFVHTPQSLACKSNALLLAKSRVNVLLFGESAVGKSRVMEDCLQNLYTSERIDTKMIQINHKTNAADIQELLERSMARKLKGLFCPHAGRRAFVVLIENLNLESKKSISFVTKTKQCSEIIRQICDTSGSFLRTTQEFAEFRDLSFLVTYSLTPFGFTRVPSRLLRHFQSIWMADYSIQMLHRVLAQFPQHFVSRFHNVCDIADVVRICQFPVEMFISFRHHFKASAVTPHFLICVKDVLRIFSSLFAVSPKAVENSAGIELYATHFTLQTYRSRMMHSSHIAALYRASLELADKFRFGPLSIDYLLSPHDHPFADHGDGEGCIRITKRAALSLFSTGDERFHWYHRSNAKDTASMPSASSGQTTSADPPVKPTPTTSSPTHVRLLSPEMRKRSSSRLITPVASRHSFAGTGPGEQSRRSSLTIAAIKTAAQEKGTISTPGMVDNMLDVYAFLQGGAHHILLCGYDSACRRSTLMIACGALSFHFKEVTTEFKMGDFVEQLKGCVLTAGLKATHTLIYVDCDHISRDEHELVMQLLLLGDIPAQYYSTSDKAKIFAMENQLKPPTANASQKRPSTSSLLDDLDSTHSVGGRYAWDGIEANSRSVYRENLRKCLYISLSFESTSMLLQLASLYPSVYYQCAIKTFLPWDDVSMEHIYQACLGDWSPLGEVLSRGSIFSHHSLSSWLPSIHRDALAFPRSNSHITSGRNHAAVQSVFEDFLGVFKILFMFQKGKVTEELSRLQDALNQLERDVYQTSVQLTREADSETLLMEAARAVIESGAKLREQEAIERDAKRAFVLDEQHCAELQAEIEQENEKIQKELAETLPHVVEATNSLAQINKHHITEMKSFTNPPQLVRLAMQAVCVLLGVQPTWSEALRILADIRFLDRLRNFEKDKVDAELIERVRLYVNHPDFRMENMKRASLASTTLCKWVLSLVRYFDAMKRVSPTQKKLDETQKQFAIIDELVRTEREKLIELELVLNDLREVHLKNVQYEEDLKRTFDAKMRWRAEVSHFSQVIAKWMEMINSKIRRLKEQRGRLIGDCGVVAAIITYGIDVGYQERAELISKWQNSAYDHINAGTTTMAARTGLGVISLPYPHSFLKYWQISGRPGVSDLHKMIIGMKDSHDTPFIMNMFVLDQVQQVCFKYPLLVDPLDRATRWLKQRYGVTTATIPTTPSAQGNSGTRKKSLTTALSSDATLPLPAEEREEASSTSMLVVLDACDSGLLGAIEKHVTQKPTSLILIENVAYCDETILNTVLELLSLLKKQGDNSVYFSTKTLDDVKHWKTKIWSQLSVVDFSPTAEEIEDYFVSLLLQQEAQQLEKEFEQKQLQLLAEKSKAFQVFDGFLSHCRSKDTDSEAVSLSPPKSASGHRINPHQIYVDEYEMTWLSKHLDDFLGAKHRYKQARGRLQQLQARRNEAVVFAKRSRAFVVADEFFGRLFPDARMPFSHCIELVKWCIELRDPNEPVVSQGHQGMNVKEIALKATENLSLAFLQKRLVAIPAQNRMIYKLLVAAAIAQVNDEIDPALMQSLANDQVVQGILNRSRGQGGMHAHRHDTMELTVVKHVSRQVVLHAITIASLNHIELKVSQGRTPHTPHRGAGRLSRSHFRLRELDMELTCAYSKLQLLFNREGFKPPESFKHKFDKLLLDDLIMAPQVWLDFLKAKPTTLTKRFHVPRPIWFSSSLHILEKLLVHMCLFDYVTLEMLEEVIAHQIGFRVLEQLHEKEGEANNLTVLANDASSSTPLILISNPQRQISIPFSRVLFCSRLLGVREESLTKLSMITTGDAIKLLNKINAIVEVAASGGWLLLHDFESATDASQNALRKQIMSLRDGSRAANDFRMWIFHSTAARRRCDSILAMTHRNGGLDIVSGDRIYCEFPQTLTAYYHYFNQQLEDQRQHMEMKAEQSSPVKLLTVAQALTKPDAQVSQTHARRNSLHASVSASLATGFEHHWTQDALLIFHSIFRCHLEDVRLDAAISNPNAPARVRESTQQSPSVPTDMMISHFELERSLRLFRLHSSQKTRAMSMTGTSLSSLWPPSAMSNDFKSLVEMASLVYTGKLWHPVRSMQCFELLSWCLSSDHAVMAKENSTVGAAPKSVEERLKDLRERLPARVRGFASNALLVEMEFLPSSLHQYITTRKGNQAIRAISSAFASKAKTAVAPAEPRDPPILSKAQRSLKMLVARFPQKSSLATTIKQQQHQRHASIVVSWGKGHAAGSSDQTRHAAPHRGHLQLFHPSNRSALTWQQAVWAHLVLVEVPAIEAYLQHVWKMTELIMSLTPNDQIILAMPTGAAVSEDSPSEYQEIHDLLQALARGLVPNTWQGKNEMTTTMSQVRSDQGYTTPRYLKDWTAWFQQTIKFYRSISHLTVHYVVDDGSPLSNLTDPIWLPALQYPRGFFFAFCHGVASEHQIPYHGITLCVSNTAKADEDGSNNGKGEALPSVTISGLFLWNAGWSSDLGVLIETKAAITSKAPTWTAAPLQVLPPFTLQATTRFDHHPDDTILTTAEKVRHDAQALYYRCPVYATVADMSALEDPITYIYMPTANSAGTMMVNGVAMFLSEELD